MGAKTEPAKLPKIYYVNWFRRDEQGNFLWPGYGENSRVLKWIFERVMNRAEYKTTPIGILPTNSALDISNLDLSPGALDKLLEVDVSGWLKEVPLIKEHFQKFGDRMPEELIDQAIQLEGRLNSA